jgi:hypothetical protein
MGGRYIEAELRGSLPITAGVSALSSVYIIYPVAGLRLDHKRRA